MTPALETIGLHKRFGALVVANDINFRLEPGARHALIGPNGAGKTTFVNLITGRLAPSAGRVLLNGEDITALPQAARVRRGLGRTFQINTLFRGLSVLENVCLAVGEHAGIGGDMLRSISRGSGDLEDAYALLRTTRHRRRRTDPGQALPYGKQRLVEIAIALGLRADSAAAGRTRCRRAVRRKARIILDVIEQLPADIAVLIIEHDMELVFRFARRITVLVQGTVLVEGTPAEIAADAARARGLSRRAAAWLTVSTLRDVSRRLWRDRGAGRHLARPSRKAAPWRCWAATASARRRCWRRCSATRHFMAARSHSAASRSSGCGHSSARVWASAMCRRSARSSRR